MTPAAREQFLKLGLEPAASTAREFQALVAAAVANFGEAVRAAGIAPE